jgi:hypothetical protein
VSARGRYVGSGAKSLTNRVRDTLRFCVQLLDRRGWIYSEEGQHDFAQLRAVLGLLTTSDQAVKIHCLARSPFPVSAWRRVPQAPIYIRLEDS